MCFEGRFQRTARPVLIAVFLAAASVCAASEKTKVFILAGQSNMDGRARAVGITDEDWARIHKVQDRIQLYFNHGTDTMFTVHKPKPGILNRFGAKAMFGPGLLFGLSLAEAMPNDHFVLIKRSIGGTSLYGVWNPDWEKEKAVQMKEGWRQPLYSDFVNYVKEVLSGWIPIRMNCAGCCGCRGKRTVATRLLPGVTKAIFRI